jgi:hypothetical protein
MPVCLDGPERLPKEKLQCHSRTGQVRVSVLVLLFAVMVLANHPANAALSPSQQNESQASPKPITGVMPAPVAASEPPPPPPTPEQLPPHAPEVVWDGKQLSIDADNSTLYAILVAVRSRLGVNIEVPGSAASERVTVRLGPAPAREVLSALLEGSNYNYIIMAGESNQSEIQSMTLTLRGEGIYRDSHDDTDTNSGSIAGSSAVRRMPGYSRSGRPAFQEQLAPDRETSSTPDPSSPIPETTEPATLSVDSNQPASQPVAETPVSRDASSQPASQPVAETPVSRDASPQPASQPVAETPMTNASPVEASHGGDTNPLVIQSTPVTAGAVVGPIPTTTAGQTDQLQRMYELRQQMQKQSNQGTTPPPQP